MQEKNSRKPDADFLRVIASFMVVLIHVIGERIGPAAYSSSLILPATINAICHVSIPIFIMLSGRFMLSRPGSVEKALKKAGKTFLQLILWGALYFVLDIVIFKNPVTFGMNIIKDILTKPLHLWYFYAAIALYLLTPFCAVFVQHATKKEATYALWFTFIFGSVLHILCQTPFAGIVPTLLSKMKLDTSLGFLFCFLFGDYIYRYELKKKTKTLIYILSIILMCLTPTITLYFASVKGGAPDYTLYSFVSPTILMPALGIMLCTKDRFSNLHWIHKIALQTPGIYGIHVLLIWLFPKYLFADLPPFLQCILIGIFVYCFSLMIVYISKKCIFPKQRKLR